ncbi:MAG: trimethylamine methyltransferase family protein [Spirochaetota bacterium]|nr:MAG: trimethylamine methyltransferase family protein [Spirochaetota bacterium]
MIKPYLRLLSGDDLKKIHEASLSILENTGMLIDHQEARNMLQEAGANVDHEKKIVKFPPELVEETLKNMDRTILHAGRDPEYDAVLKIGEDFCTRTAGGATSYIDLKTGDYRRAKISDLEEFATLVDALPNVNAVGTLHCGDIPEQTADIHCLQTLLEKQRKNIVHNAFTVKNLEYMIEMMLAVRGTKEKLKERPLVHTIIAVLSPLYMPEDDIDQLILAGKYGIPTGVVIMPSVGSASPITLAGTLAQGNAELLGSITLAQVANPGHPIPYFFEPTVTEMKSGDSLMGTPESAMLCAAIAQLGIEFYGFPPNGIGLMSDGAICEQTLFQKACNGVMQCLGGGSLLIAAGAIDSVLAISPIQLVIDDEIIGMLHRISRGIEVNDDTLALDIIDKVGPRGSFLAQAHTVLHLREGDLFNPHIFDWNKRDKWITRGAKGLEQRAREKAMDILKNHKVDPLPDNVLKELRAIVKKANDTLV